MFVRTFLEIAVYRPVTQRFFHWVQKVIAEKLDATRISQTSEGNFTQFWSQMHVDMLVKFGVKKSKVKVTIGSGPKTGEYSIFVNIWANFISCAHFISDMTSFGCRDSVRPVLWIST